MKNEKAILNLEQKIKERDNLNQEIREDFKASIDAIEKSERKLKENFLFGSLKVHWTKNKIQLKELAGTDYHSNLVALKELMNLLEYSEFLEAKNEQD